MGFHKERRQVLAAGARPGPAALPAGVSGARAKRGPGATRGKDKSHQKERPCLPGPPATAPDGGFANDRRGRVALHVWAPSGKGNPLVSLLRVTVASLSQGGLKSGLTLMCRGPNFLRGGRDTQNTTVEGSEEGNDPVPASASIAPRPGCPQGEAHEVVAWRGAALTPPRPGTPCQRVAVAPETVEPRGWAPPG